MQIVCPSCQALNRLPENRDTKAAQCGKCKQSLFPGTVQDVSADVLNRHITKNDIAVVVDFWASWCGPCQMMAPQFQAAASELEPEFRLLKLNTENAQTLSAQLNIRSIPTMIIFKAGKEAARTAGAMDKSQIVSWVKQHR